MWLRLKAAGSECIGTCEDMATTGGGVPGLSVAECVVRRLKSSHTRTLLYLFSRVSHRIPVAAFVRPIA